MYHGQISSTSSRVCAKGSAVAKMQRIAITEVDDDEDSEESDENAEETVEPVVDDSKDLQRHRTNILVVQEEWQILMNWIDFVFRITH